MHGWSDSFRLNEPSQELFLFSHRLYPLQLLEPLLEEKMEELIAVVLLLCLPIGGTSVVGRRIGEGPGKRKGGRTREEEGKKGGRRREEGKKDQGRRREEGRKETGRRRIEEEGKKDKGRTGSPVEVHPSRNAHNLDRTPTCMRKKKKTSEIAGAIKEMVEHSRARLEFFTASSSPSPTSIVTSSGFSVASCVKFWDSMPDLDRELYVRAVNHLQKNPEWRDAFFTMEDHRKL
ncbi:hypothetical protein NE237_025385 [Protea cynaroides]|uniref:Uncharacterized protein n=1 Tax=Protea cynaroides TaxID=273540 RepID=A0A9Q0H314_9MAGN|nr:hypothetical protein NE237_025385 [Protea cynaroides]